MDFLEYKAKAQETRIYPEEYKVIYPMLKLLGELGELKSARTVEDKIKELGDVFWYIAAICSDLEIQENYKLKKEKEIETPLSSDWPDVMFESHVSIGLDNACKASESLGKILRDGKVKKEISGEIKITENTDNMFEVLEHHLRALANNMACCCEALKVSASFVFEVNLQKLQSRKERGVLKGSGDNR